ncbi:MAG: toxin-antitoxin system YwqK family antitoxin [Saprospiraceae bacterium]
MKNHLFTTSILLSLFICCTSCSTQAQPQEKLQNPTEEFIKDTSLNSTSYFKQVYTQEKLVRASDEKMLSIADSLFSGNYSTSLFHFIVFTKSMNGADGFYSEILCSSAHKYIMEQTLSFTKHFTATPKLGEPDIDNWASSIYGEIQISREGDEALAIKQIEKVMLNNVQAASPAHRDFIKQLIRKIKYNHKSNDFSKASVRQESQDTLKTNLLLNGQKDGLWKTFHSNGQLKREGLYVLGKKEGIHKEWGETGILLVEEVFQNGKGNGLTQWFHDGGHLAGEGQMVDDLRQGPWKICDIEENGFCIDANFVDGKREGLWKIYHDKTNTNVWKEQTFKDNQMVAEKCFDMKGTAIECK